MCHFSCLGMCACLGASCIVSGIVCNCVRTPKPASCLRVSVFGGAVDGVCLPQVLAALKVLHERSSSDSTPAYATRHCARIALALTLRTLNMLKPVLAAPLELVLRLCRCLPRCLLRMPRSRRDCGRAHTPCKAPKLVLGAAERLKSKCARRVGPGLGLETFETFETFETWPQVRPRSLDFFEYLRVVGDVPCRPRRAARRCKVRCHGGLGGGAG